MKRYYNNNNLDIDPIRSAWNNSNMEGFHKPINKLREDIMINNISIENTPRNYNQMNTPLNQRNNHLFESFSNLPNNNLLPKMNKQLNVPPPSYEEKLNSKGSSYSLVTNNYHNMDDPRIQLLPLNNKNTNTNTNNKIVPKNNHMNITNYNNDKFRMNNITSELFEKDEEIQKYKNEIYHLQLEINEVKKEKSQMISADVENKLLKEKLNEQFEISREVTNLKHILKRTQIENKGNNDTIETLKNIIHKQHVQLINKPSVKSKQIIISDSDSDSDYDSPFRNDGPLYVSQKSSLENAYIIAGFPIPGYKNAICKSVFDFLKYYYNRLNGPLFRILRTQEGKAYKYFAETEYQSLQGFFAFHVYTSEEHLLHKPNSSKIKKDMIHSILQIVMDLKKHGISEQDMQDTKEHIKQVLKMKRSDESARADYNARELFGCTCTDMNTRNFVIFTDIYRKKFASLTRDTVQKYIDTYLLPTRFLLTVTTEKPPSKKQMDNILRKTFNS